MVSYCQPFSFCIDFINILLRNVGLMNYFENKQHGKQTTTGKVIVRRSNHSISITVTHSLKIECSNLLFLDRGRHVMKKQPEKKVVEFRGQSVY